MIKNSRYIIFFLVLFLSTSILGQTQQRILTTVEEKNSEEVIHTLPPLMSVRSVQTPASETYPGFLTKRGDFQRLKQLSGNGKGIKVGIVDTGLDTTHSQPGGELPLGEAVKAVKDFTNSRFD